MWNRACTVRDKLAVTEDVRRMFARVHSFSVIVDESFLGRPGWRAADFERISPGLRHGITSRDPAMQFYFWRLVDIEDYMPRLEWGNDLRMKMSHIFFLWQHGGPLS